MDLSADSGTLPTHNTVRGPVLEQELSLSSARCQTESGDTISLQLLEFKTHLLEAVEELHIRRDAETRFEDQISKLVFEKQELEWEKESLQNQIKTVANQHRESLASVKKQLQAKIRNTEEEKGKYQVSAELKDKEINNLKEELKSLQLLKYNLEKKSNELELKLALQSRSKDSHLNQLAEAEKRFSALSRQCAVFKQAHEKLEQNVDEAMKINKKLTIANEKQEATIVSLKKELEVVSNKLIKAKLSSVLDNKAHSPTGREQRLQQLHQKLNMETEMNKKLREEIEAVRAEKQEVMRSLQQTQQLLLSQTRTVSGVELELQTHREQYQALKQEHRVMREKSKAMEDKVAGLMESFTASKISWDKEKAMFLDRIKSEKQDLHAVKEAFDKLHQEHTELSSQAQVQAQHIHDLEIRDSSQSVSVSTQVSPSLLEEVGREETLNEAISSSELPSFGSLQNLASTQSRNPDCLEDTGAVTKPVDTGATGESTVLSPSHRSIDGSVLSKEKCDEDNGGMSEKEQGWTDYVKQVDNNREEGEINEEQQWKTEEVQEEDVTEEGGATKKRGMVIAQTTDSDRRDDSQGSTEDAADPKQPETETKDRADREGTHGMEGRGKTELHTAETQIPDQTTYQTEESDTQQAIDFMDTEPPLAAREPSQSLFQEVTEEDADSSLMSNAYQTSGDVHTFCCDESVDHGLNSVIKEVLHLSQDDVQTFAESVTQLPRPSHQDFEKISEKKPLNKSAASISSELSGTLNQSVVCSSHTNTAPLAAQSDDTVQEIETTLTQPRNPSELTSNMKQKDEMCDTHVNDECVSVMVAPQTLPQSQEQSGQLKCLVTNDDDDSDSSAYEKRENQSKESQMQENDACETVQESLEKPILKDACADILMDTVEPESWAEIGSCQEHMKNETTEDARYPKTTDLKPPVHPSPKSDAPQGTCSEQSPAGEMLLDGTDELPLPSVKTHRSSFDWGSAQREAESSRTKSDVSILNQFVQRSPLPEKNLSGAVGPLRHPPSTIPTFFTSKHHKVPLVITRASDLLNASSVSGNAASSRRHQQREWMALGEMATADTETRASPSITSFPVSTSITASRMSWQTTPGCSRAPTSAAVSSSELDWELSCSQDREDQQSSFRAQISKIEQFLNTERLRLAKRRRTDN